MKIGILMHSVRFEADKIAEKVARKTVSSLKKASAYLRKSICNSIRKSPNPSKPGKPPHTHGDKEPLKNAVRFKVDEANLTARVGVTEDLGVTPSLSRIATLHEYGAHLPNKHGVYRIGGGGPIEAVWPLPKGKRERQAQPFHKTFRFAKLKSAAQVAKATRLFTAFYGMPPKGTSDYPERSFVRSTTTRVLPVIMQKFFS